MRKRKPTKAQLLARNRYQVKGRLTMMKGLCAYMLKHDKLSQTERIDLLSIETKLSYLLSDFRSSTSEVKHNDPFNEL